MLSGLMLESSAVLDITSLPFIDPRSVSPRYFEEIGTQFGISRVNLRPILGAVIGRGDLEPSSWAALGLLPLKKVAQIAPLPRLKLESVVTSATDGFKKLLFRTEDGLPLETVIIPLHKEGKVSICLSSQVGCVMGCTFCATARMTQRRNLQSWEILDQMNQARQVASQDGKVVTGAVFMGMGEPFLNYQNVMIAAEHLCYPVLNAISSKAITVSTVGLVDEIDKFTNEKRPFRLSISLGAATDEKRAKLVPVAAKTPIAKVIAAARRYTESRNDRINLAYVCVSGENIAEEDARALAAVIGDLPVRLDLIDVTDSSGRYQRPSEDQIKTFRDQLNIYLKQPVVRRYSGGADIRAACGTLAGGS